MDNRPKSGKIDEISALMLDWLNQFNSDDSVDQMHNNNELPIELLTNTTGTNLQHLNDDCLLEIFSSKSLSLMDLCSLAETCKRFLQLIQRITPKQLSICRSCEHTYKLEARKYAYETRLRKEVVRVFKNLGSFLCDALSISISGYRYTNEDFFLLNLLSNHCVENLQSLTIQSVDIPEIFTVKLKPVFAQLHSLALCYVNFVGSTNNLFAGLSSLVELKIDKIKSYEAILQNSFPKLEKLIYISCTDPREKPISSIFSTFFSRHTALKTVEIYKYGYDYDDRCITIILQTIGNSCRRLEKLSIKFSVLSSSLHLQPLQSLTLLRSLELRSATCEDLRFFSALTELRELELSYCLPPIDVNQFAFLTQLKKLEMSFAKSCDESVVVNIISKLVALRELTIYANHHLPNDFRLDEELLSDIIHAVRERQNVLTLRCHVDYYVNQSIENGEKHRNVRVLRHHDRS